eukprot:1485905-Alexandrium_andersonii.AAC.1
MYAWWRLVKVWASLRFDDHRSMEPANVRMGPTGLIGTLTRTKTSGLGKRHEVLGLFVLEGAFVADPQWLT